MDLATRQKWIAGAKPAAPLFIAVGSALSLGVVIGTRHLRMNPEVVVSKTTRAVDLTDGSRGAKGISREGEAYHDNAFRSYLRSAFFTGEKGTLDNAQPSSCASCTATTSTERAGQGALRRRAGFSRRRRRQLPSLSAAARHAL